MNERELEILTVGPTRTIEYEIALALLKFRAALGWRWYIFIALAHVYSAYRAISKRR